MQSLGDRGKEELLVVGLAAVYHFEEPTMLGDDGDAPLEPREQVTAFEALPPELVSRPPVHIIDARSA
jgi:hypothetical protein